MKTATTALKLFTSEQDFNGLLDVGSTPQLEQMKHQLIAKIASFGNAVRTAQKDLFEARLRSVRQELSAR